MPAKKTTQKKSSRNETPRPTSFFGRFRAKMIDPLGIRVRSLMSRRPHRSFQRTRRRDYVRSLKLPGYWSFTNEVRKTLWRNRKTFLWLIAIYAILNILFVGLSSQDTYTQLSELLRDTSGEIFKGHWGEIGKAGLLLITGVSGDYSSPLTEVQQVYAVILVFFTWLTSVWLLRAFVAGKKPKLRDGLYNAGAPVLPTFLVGLLLAIQLLPIVVVVLGFTALVPFGILDGGAEAMIFWLAALLLIILSLYWITSTLIALVVITLPGMYPMQAIRAAGDLVVGRRLRILFRLLWLALITAALWAAVMIPIILLDAWIKGIWPAVSWVPIVPFMLLAMGTVTVVWVSSYIYLFYRRVVDDDASPA